MTDIQPPDFEAPGLVILRLPDAYRMAVLHAQAFGIDNRWSEAGFADLLGLKTTLAIGVERGEVLAGLLVVQSVLGDAEILTLAVAPEMRRRGFARKMMNAAAQLLAQRGAGRFLLEVAADNAPAIALYRALDFNQDGRRPKYYARAGRGRVDAILLSRPVAGQVCP